MNYVWRHAKSGPAGERGRFIWSYITLFQDADTEGIVVVLAASASLGDGYIWIKKLIPFFYLWGRVRTGLAFNLFQS